MNKNAHLDRILEDRKNSLKSAEVIIPIVLGLIKPKSVVDVGCGNGEWLHVFRKHGVSDVLGIDGKWINKKRLVIPEHLFIAADLEQPLGIKRTFDLVVSLEVAEHLSKKSAKTFVQSLTGLGPVILFSAAIPFQGGIHHVNEQWPDYWAKLFREKGYFPVDCIRKKVWNNNNVGFWYAQTILLFVKKGYTKNNKLLKQEMEKTNGSPLSVVHPKMYLRSARVYNLMARCVPYFVRKAIRKRKLFRL